MTEYELLEIDEHATDEDIKRAFKLHSFAWSSDRFPQSFIDEVKERHAMINEAYNTLINHDLRKRLDKRLGIKEVSKDQTLSKNQFEISEQRVPENWKQLARWAKDEDKLSKSSRKFAFSIADQYLEKTRALTDRQLDWAKNIWDEAIKEGFDPGDEN